MMSGQDEVVSGLDKLLEPFHGTDKPGLVIGVALRDQVIYRRGVGMASLEHAVANTPRTRMRIGSTSKQFTSLAIMLLAEDGKLSPDDSVRKYLPDLPTLKGEPTLRQLMQHTGGYRCYLDLQFYGNGTVMNAVGDHLAPMVRQEDVNFPPGERTIYNNGGYYMLSLVVEQVSGMSFEEFLETRIFQPLGMNDTTHERSDLRIIPGMATLHLPSPKGGYDRGLFPSVNVLGEGGMVSTVSDMLRWCRHLRGPKTVGTEETWKQILTPTTYTNGTRGTYALGLMVDEYRGHRVIHHAGGVMGGTCQMMTLPEQGLDLILIANGADMHSGRLYHRVIDTVLGEEKLAPIAASAAVSENKGEVGKYWNPSTRQGIEVSDADGKISACWLAFPLPMQFKADAEDWEPIDSSVSPLKIVPGEYVDGKMRNLTVYDCGNPSTMTRLPDPPPDIGSMESLYGRYTSHDLDASADISRVGDTTILVMKGELGTMKGKLVALSEGLISAVFDTNLMPIPALLTLLPNGDGFRLDTARTRNVLFRKA